jgi:hypothetical protein
LRDCEELLKKETEENYSIILKNAIIIINNLLKLCKYFYGNLFTNLDHSFSLEQGWLMLGWRAIFGPPGLFEWSV